jgi:hypothetical protein
MFKKMEKVLMSIETRNFNCEMGTIQYDVASQIAAIFPGADNP